jgi:hypothetical protein
MIPAFEPAYARDRIQIPPPNVALWSENLLVWFHDPATGLCLWTHLGRMAYNADIWEGVSYVLLPDGEVLANHSMGVCRHECRIGNEYLVVPVWPGKTWQFRFDGLAQRAKAADLSTRLIAHEHYEPLSYDLVFEGLHPLFDFSHASMTDQAWGTMHLEQGGSVRGTVRFGGREHEINCTGYRDHSAGPRNNEPLLSDEWVLCVFPSGRVFGAFHVTEVGNKNPMKSGFIYEDGKVHSIETLVMPALDDACGNPKQFTVKALCNGRERILHGTMGDRYFPVTLTLPTGLATGIDPASPSLPCSIEAPAIYTFEGETGHGWIERIRRVENLLRS